MSPHTKTVLRRYRLGPCLAWLLLAGWSPAWAEDALLVCGNQWGAGGQRPFSVALSQVSDAVVVETGGSALSATNRAWDALATKLPLAAGEYRRPVWLYMTSLFHAPEETR